VNRFTALDRHRFGRRRDLAHANLLPQSEWSETDLGEQKKTDDGAGPARPMDDEVNRELTDPYPVSAEEIRLHAWLMERLMLLHHERYGWWPRIRRFLFDSRPIRQLVQHSFGENDRLRKTRSDIRGVLGDGSTDAASFSTTQFRPY
jgi:hypothetical protein